MILRKSALLSVALLILATLVLPLGTSSASVSAPQSSEAVPGSPADPSALASEMPTDQIIVKYKIPASMVGTTGPASALAMQRLSDAAGIPLTFVREMSGDAYVLGLPSRMPLEEVQAMADRMSTLPEVEYAEPDAIMQPTLTPDDPRYTDQWHYFAPGAGHYGINAPAAWDITTGSSSIVVAVIDTGITNHADLAGRTVPGYDFIADSQVANDGGGRDSNPSDPGDWITSAENSSGYFAGCGVRNSSWHGTHTAGTIGAASNNGTGVAGVNWASKILPVRVLGKCGGTTSDIADGMRWAAGLPVPGVPANGNPAKVLNLSLGGKSSCSSTYQDAVNAIVAAGSTAVISAGNSNDDASLYSPGNCNGVVTVAATNRNGSRAFYSNYGATVEISAPGGETSPTSSNGVLSTLNTGTQGPLADTYTYYQGTSMAAPHVAGVASLLYSRKPSLTPAQVLSYLQSTVTAFPAGSTCSTSNCGSGIVNAGAAVAAVPTSVLDKKVYLPLVLNGYPPTVGWTTMVSTDFEGTWPSPWVVSDNDGATNGEYYWGKRNCRAYAGSYSGWGVGAGAQGSGLGCGSNYPDNAVSWMRYGPFSLSSTTAADLKFKLWMNSEIDVDKVCRFASIDGTNYWGTCTSGNTSGWTDRVLDLSNVYTLGNLLGQPSVWIAIVFYSDSSDTFAEGGYVDNIVLRKCPSGGTCPAAAVQTILSDSQVTESPVHMILPR